MDKQTKILLAVIGIIAAVIAIYRLHELNPKCLQETWYKLTRAYYAVVPPPLPEKEGIIDLIAPAGAAVETLLAPNPQIIKVTPPGGDPEYLYWYFLIGINHEVSVLAFRKEEINAQTGQLKWQITPGGTTVSTDDFGQILNAAPSVAQVEQLWGKPGQVISGYNHRAFLKYLYVLKPVTTPPGANAPGARLLLDISDDRVQNWGILSSGSFDLAKLESKHFGGIKYK